jgi:Mg/Co/Ni transporter MgtE
VRVAKHTLPGVADIADRSVPTCRLGERAADVRRRIGTTHVCVVLNDVDVVPGLVRADALAAEPDVRVDELMQEGPPTFRPDVGAGELPSYLRKRRVARAVVTTSNGKFIGLLRMDEFDGTGGHSRA